MRRQSDEKVELLSMLPLFATCSHRELRQVARVAEVIDVDAGAVLVREGGEAREFFGIVEGCAVVSCRGRAVARRGRGDYFGELGVLTGSRRDAQVTADTPMRLVVIERRALLWILHELSDVRRALLRGMVRRLRDSDVQDTAVRTAGA